MIKIAICDNVYQDRKLIVDFCIKFLERKFIKYEIREYASGESFLVEDFPDVLFLNTEIKLIDGLLVKEVLCKLRANTKIVFVSNQLECMENAFGKNVYAFVKKPVSYTAFSKFMTDILKDVEDEKRIIYCKNIHKIEQIYMRDIVYIKSHGRYTKVYLRGEENYRLSDYSFGDWYLELEDQEFLCCYRGYLVNLFYIKNVNKEVELYNGQRLPIGDKKKKEFWQSYKAYMERMRKWIMK